MTKPRRKLDVSGLAAIHAYHDFWRTKINAGGKVRRGTMYILSNALTDAQKTDLLSYANVRLYCSQSQYAPELIRNAVLLLDTCPTK